MPIDSFTTTVLNGVVRSLQTSPRFLADTFFPTEQREESEEIHFDIEATKFRLSPFVSPLVEGQIVESLGVAMKYFKPAYIKDKRQWNPNRAFKRRIGENVGGSMSPEERQRAQLRADMEDQISMLRNRLEWMAAKILATGQVTISGDKYPTVVVNFGRLATHTVTLTGGAKWDQVGVNPLTDLETWSQLVFDDSGSMPMRVVMDVASWKVFRNNDDVRAHLDLWRTANSMPTLKADQAIETGAVFMGVILNFQIWVYSGSYHDDAGVATKYLPNGTVLMVGDIAGAQAFGAIRDVEQLNAVPYWSKSWVTQDPSIRWLMMQSAPLLVPYRPDASLAATVI